MNTNHIQIGSYAYCRLLDDIVSLDKHIESVCLSRSCPYFAGDAQGSGVECEWDDGSSEAFYTYTSGEDISRLMDQTHNLSKSEVKSARISRVKVRHEEAKDR